MEAENIIDFDKQAANQAIIEGLLKNGISYIEKLQKITILEIDEVDEILVEKSFKKLAKAIHRNEISLKNFKLLHLLNFGFTNDLIKKIGFCAITLENESPRDEIYHRTKAYIPRRSSKGGDDDTANIYNEDDFEIYDEGDDPTENIQFNSKSQKGKVEIGKQHSQTSISSPQKRSRKTAIWIAEGRWKLGEQIGSGSFGEVFQGMDDKGKLFAVKRLKIPGHSNEILNLVEEIELMRKLRHQNIVEYLGANVSIIF